MGPLFFRAENGNANGHGTNGHTGFNGAALFQSGERVWLLSSDSTGGLQWGRSFSERRTGLPDCRDPDTHGASMGPLFFRAENPLRLAPLAGALLASMGPLFFRAENPLRLAPLAGALLASMGPLFFRAENNPPVPLRHELATPLQWGRSFSERRTEVAQ